ncbi:MAG: hypothetical protein H0U76_18070 [Ktedonobacteraceae bacterium]|nr:hypothetical protein [Ktedonobacteraceae bacterium]
MDLKITQTGPADWPEDVLFTYPLGGQIHQQRVHGVVKEQGGIQYREFRWTHQLPGPNPGPDIRLRHLQSDDTGYARMPAPGVARAQVEQWLKRVDPKVYLKIRRRRRR